MKIYLISYDLNKSGQNYNSLYETIENIGGWWHCLDSTWIVKTNQTAVQIRDTLSSNIDQNDSLLITELSGVAAWTGFDTDCSAWLKNNL